MSEKELHDAFEKYARANLDAIDMELEPSVYGDYRFPEINAAWHSFVAGFELAKSQANTQ